MPLTVSDILLRLDLFHLHPLLRNYQLVIVRGERWVVLLGDPQKIPLFAARRRYEPALQGDEDAASRSTLQGRPEWYDDAKFWWPYAPDVFVARELTPELAQTWLLWDYDSSTHFVDALNSRRISRTVIQLIRADFEMAKEMLTAWDGRGGLHKEMVEAEYDATGLYLCTGLYNMRTALGQARAAFLNLVAAISYMFHHGDDRDREVMKDTYGEQVRGWRIDRQAKIGTMLDLRGRPREVVPLVNLLKHQRLLPLGRGVSGQIIPGSAAPRASDARREELRGGILPSVRKPSTAVTRALVDGGPSRLVARSSRPAPEHLSCGSGRPAHQQSRRTVALDPRGHTLLQPKPRSRSHRSRLVSRGPRSRCLTHR